MNYFNKSADYSDLISQLAFYRDAHELDRAAKLATQLIIDDLAEHLSTTRIQEMEDETQAQQASIKEAVLATLDDIISGYGVPEDATPDDIILALAEDGYIDAANEDEYYRALSAAEEYLAERASEWDVD